MSESTEQDVEYQENGAESADKPITEWEKEPTVKDLKQDYTDAESDRTAHVNQVNTWLENLNITGNAKHKKVTGKSSIQPKLIRKQAEWRYASLAEPFLSTEDIFNTAPVTYEDKKAAIQNGLVLNNQLNTKIKKVAFIDEYVRTLVDEGTAIIRVGWEFEEYAVEVTRDITEIVTINGPNGPEQVEAPTGEAQTVTEMRTVKNHPTLEVCDYRNLTIDPSCKGDISKAKFIIYSFETCLADLKAQGDKYTNLDDIVISNASILGLPDDEKSTDSDFNFSDDDRKLFMVHEYWGYRDVEGEGELTSIVASWAGNTMIRMEENPFPDQELPFVAVQYLPVRKSIYGEPDGELLKDNQDVIGAVTRGMIDTMARSANGQRGFRKDSLDVVNRRKFENGSDYEFNGAVDPSQAFHMHKFEQIPQSAEYMLNTQNAEAESMSGIKSFSAGISGQALGTTATGIRSALDATAKRELGILRRLAEGIIQVGRKIVSMNAEFLDETEVVRITNEEFVQIKRDDLQGNFDLKLTISTAEADNDKAQELSFMLQTMGNNMDANMSKIILTEIARLRKMPELAKAIEAFEPQPDPRAIKKADLEIALLEAQVRGEEVKTAENNADIELKRAKARQLNSTSDKQDLDFVEQESGTQHMRDIDKQNNGTQNKLDEKAADNFFASDDTPTPTKVPTSTAGQPAQ